VLKGTIVQSLVLCLKFGDIAMTGLFFVISGILRPLKSHIRIVPGVG
jgi:hypothetical protein